ncbi:MAG: YbhN family protein [Thermodesulfobacteriota bacterium]
MTKKVLTTLIKFFVSGGILYLLFRNMDLKQFFHDIRTVSPYAIIFVALFFICLQAISAFRWSIILRKDVEVPYRKLLAIYFVGMFFNNFLPTMVGGDIIKGVYLYRESRKGGVSVASIFMDRYSGFSALIIITSIALVTGYTLIQGTGLPGFLLLLIGGYTAASLVIWVGPLHSWAMKIFARIHFYGINHKIDALYKTLMGYKGHKDILVKIMFLSFVVQAGVIVGYYIFAQSLGIEVRLAYFFFFIPIATVITMLPISVGGLGIREGAFVYLFTMVGATKAQALSLSLIWYAVMVAVSMIGGAAFIKMGGRPSEMAEEAKDL